MFLKAINYRLMEVCSDGFALEGRVAAVHLCWCSRNDHDQPTTHHSKTLDRYQKCKYRRSDAKRYHPDGAGMHDNITRIEDERFYNNIVVSATAETVDGYK